LLGKEGAEGHRIKGGGVLIPFKGHHDLVTGAFVGDGVGGGQYNSRETSKNALHGCGSKVFTVHTDPVRVTAGKVDPVLVIAVSEVTGPIPTIAEASAFGFVVLPVALKACPTTARNHLANCCFSVGDSPLIIEDCPRAFFAAVGVDHENGLTGLAERSSWSSREAGE